MLCRLVTEGKPTDSDSNSDQSQRKEAIKWTNQDLILEVAAKRGKTVHSKSRSGLVLILIGLESSDEVIMTHGGGVNTIWDVQWRVCDYKVIYLRFTVWWSGISR